MGGKAIGWKSLGQARATQSASDRGRLPQSPASSERQQSCCDYLHTAAVTEARVGSLKLPGGQANTHTLVAKLIPVRRVSSGFAASSLQRIMKTGPMPAASAGPEAQQASVKAGMLHAQAPLVTSWVTNLLIPVPCVPRKTMFHSNTQEWHIDPMSVWSLATFTRYQGR